MIQRLSFRAIGSLLRRQALTRGARSSHQEIRNLLTGCLEGFRIATAHNAAQAMTMPAMSPTMTEGAIATWKVAEGTSCPTPPH